MGTADDGIHDHLIGALTPHQCRSGVTFLSTRLLPALLAQAPGLPHEAVGGRGQVTVVTVFGLLLFQGLEALLQLRDQFISLGQLLPQVLILLSQLKHFFFCRHACTLHLIALFGKSLGHLRVAYFT